jgi:hypothetical protein
MRFVNDRPAVRSVLVQPDLLDRRALADRLETVRSDVQSNLERLSATLAQVEESRKKWEAGRDSRTVLHQSAYARLLARFESQPVIEQAKGILMAESHCSPDEAFEMLRRASQRQNIRVRDLAAQIVARASGAHRHRPSGAPQRESRPNGGVPANGSADRPAPPADSGPPVVS